MKKNEEKLSGRERKTVRKRETVGKWEEEEMGTDTRQQSGSSVRAKNRQKRPCEGRVRTGSICGELLVLS